MFYKSLLFFYLMNFISFVISLKFIKYLYKKNQNDKLFDYGFYFYTTVVVVIYVYFAAILLNTFFFKNANFIILSEFHEYGNTFMSAYTVLSCHRFHYEYIYKQKEIKATDMSKFSKELKQKNKELKQKNKELKQKNKEFR